MKHQMKVYKNSAEYPAYQRARFNNGNNQSFVFVDHRWKYEVTSFDDNGDYDLLYRFDDKPYPEEASSSADDMTLRDYFAAKAMQSITLAIDNQEQHLIATAAYRMADAMLKARE